MRLPAAAAVWIALTTASTSARADDAAPLRDAGHAWLDGERSSGFLWGGAGVASLGAGAVAWRSGDVGRGMSYPLLGFGVLQTGIGIGSLARPRTRDDAFERSVSASPQDTLAKERARMRTVLAAFVAIEVVEAAVVVGGVTWAATKSGPDEKRSRGVGLGLAAEGGAMMLLDGLAALRAARYLGTLDTLRLSVAPLPGARGLAVTGAF